MENDNVNYILSKVFGKLVLRTFGRTQPVALAISRECGNLMGTSVKVSAAGTAESSFSLAAETDDHVSEMFTTSELNWKMPHLCKIEFAMFINIFYYSTSK